ncbi:DUF257 family protein [Pyrococcus horikoshii]|uniref:KaiC-like domain-containing protein n=2 Tax=Pyrococcus horikoshii TaxID=53953 RepID=O58590_PYRHO|nr:DUF257 family protein [Pyrococcus horikoshii]BAA29954.1 221aa long hypothetical protein [Pyrococcus horikoshii OT3]HII61284.1 DUF257 family protein [Pyrococcus horikoshii]
MERLEDLFEKSKFGELILFEYNSTTPLLFIVYPLIKWAREKGYPLVIFDIFDSLTIYTKQAEMLGIKDKLYEGANIVKIGGRMNLGNIILKISIIEYGPFEKTLEDTLEKAYGERENVISIVLGTEKIFSFYPFRDQFMFSNFLALKTGDRRRKAFYFVNVDLLEKISPPMGPLLEEEFTTVVKLTKEDNKIKMKVIKSLNPELDGMELKVNAHTLIASNR